MLYLFPKESILNTISIEAVLATSASRLALGVLQYARGAQLSIQANVGGWGGAKRVA